MAVSHGWLVRTSGQGRTSWQLTPPTRTSRMLVHIIWQIIWDEPSKKQLMPGSLWPNQHCKFGRWPFFQTMLWRRMALQCTENRTSHTMVTNVHRVAANGLTRSVASSTRVRIMTSTSWNICFFRDGGLCKTCSRFQSVVACGNLRVYQSYAHTASYRSWTSPEKNRKTQHQS